MNDYIHNVMWYTVWDAKTGDLVASGTAAMCARRLGYSSSGSFASAVSHWLCDGRQHVKYTIQREYIPAVRWTAYRNAASTKNKKPAGAPTPTSCKG